MPGPALGFVPVRSAHELDVGEYAIAGPRVAEEEENV
jgi:hypothetical protein